MKKLLLSALIMISAINQSKAIEPKNSNINLTALRKTQDALIFKYNSAIKDLTPILSIEYTNDETIKDLSQKIEEEKDKCPELEEVNKELEELNQQAKTLLKDKYPEEYKEIQSFGKDSFEAYSVNIKIAEKDPVFKDLLEKITKKKSFKYTFSNSNTKALNIKINQRQREILYELRPELKQINQEIKASDQKIEKILNDTPAAKEIQEQINKLNQQRSIEEKKIQKQLQEAFTNEQKKQEHQLKIETTELTKEIINTDTNIKPLIKQLKELAEEIKEIAKKNYTKEYIKIENYDPANYNLLEEETFAKACLSLSAKDSKIKDLTNQIISLGQSINSLLTRNEKFVKFMQKNIENAIKTIQKITYNINPEIEKIDKERVTLNNQLEGILEKELEKEQQQK